MGWWCIAAAPDLRARLRLTGYCIPVVKELQRQHAGQRQPQPHPLVRRKRAGGCMFPTFSCLQALPLVDFRFQKAGKKPELTLLWEPEELEEESVPQVRTPEHGTGSQQHGGCGEHVDPMMSAGTGLGGRTCLAECQVLLSLCIPFPVSPTSASASSATQPKSHHCPHNLTPPQPSVSALPPNSVSSRN